MNVGIPGTGLGGIFYILSAFFMIAYEIIQTLIGRSSIRRWKIVLSQSGLASGVIFIIWATGDLLKILLPDDLVAKLIPITTNSINYLEYVRLLIFTPFLLLAGILILAWIYSVILNFKKRFLFVKKLT